MNKQSLIRATIMILLLVVTSLVQAGEYKSYEEAFTEKAGQAFNEDINVWVYTSDFAKRFAMPQNWIDDGMKGAYAVAFRVQETPFRTYFPHKGPNVSMINRECILDVYLDDKAQIPWVDTRESAYQHRYDSARYLLPQNDRDAEHRRRPVGLPEYGEPASIRSSDKNGTITLSSYDRAIYPGVAYLSFNIGCGTPPKDKAWIEFRRGGDSADRRMLHTVEIPNIFMQRLYDNWYEKSRKPAKGEWDGVIKTPNVNGSKVINQPVKPENYINKED